MMSGKTSPIISALSFYPEESSPPKKSRLGDSNEIRPAFKHLKDNLIEFDKKLSEPIKTIDLKELRDIQEETGEEPENLDRDSPIPLKNLGNTCYENSIIQCLFGLNMFMDNFERSMRRMKGITQNDVRYRIADAFDKLYKSYTHKRIQIESNINHLQTATLSATKIVTPATTTSTTTPIATTSSTTTQATTTTDTLTSTNLTPIALVSSAATPNEQSEIETRLEELKSAVGERSSQFNSTHQQDASEFFYHVIDSIQEFYESLDKTKDDDNPVTKAFELELDYLIRCPKCHNRTMTGPEKIRTLPLALPHVNNINNECTATTTTTIENNNPSEQQEFINHNETNGAPTPPNSDLGLDSPESSTLEENRNGSDEKENQALVVDDEDEIVPVGDSASNSNNTMSIAKLELTDKSELNSTTQCQPNNNIININNNHKHYTLYDALNNYFKDDLLDYKCSQEGCDSKQRTKKCLIRKLPQVLFITLARYSYTGKKNLDEIEAPFEISVPFRENKSPSHSPSAHRTFNDDDDNLYQLVAVVCHLGSSLNAGHYTSYVYNQNNFSWYSCDDDSITKVQEAEVKTDVSRTGYCFFYAHKSSLNQKLEASLTVEEKEQVFKATKITATLMKEEAKQSIVSRSIDAINCVAESSVIMTPESSPKSSPIPHSSSNSCTSSLPETHSMHGIHDECANNGADNLDDWS